MWGVLSLDRARSSASKVCRTSATSSLLMPKVLITCYRPQNGRGCNKHQQDEGGLAPFQGGEKATNGVSATRGVGATRGHAALRRARAYGSYQTVSTAVYPRLVSILPTGGKIENFGEISFAVFCVCIQMIFPRIASIPVGERIQCTCARKYAPPTAISLLLGL